MRGSTIAWHSILHRTTGCCACLSALRYSIKVRCVEPLTPLLRIRFILTLSDSKIPKEPVILRRGVFQGDSLNLLFFCISPMSVEQGLPNFYMNDLKLYAFGEKDLQQYLRVVQKKDEQLVGGGILHHLNECESYTYWDM